MNLSSASTTPRSPSETCFLEAYQKAFAEACKQIAILRDGALSLMARTSVAKAIEELPKELRDEARVRFESVVNEEKGRQNA